MVLAVVEPAGAALAHSVRVVHVPLISRLVRDKIGLVSGHRGLRAAPDPARTKLTCCLCVIALFAAGRAPFLSLCGVDVR